MAVFCVIFFRFIMLSMKKFEQISAEKLNPVSKKNENLH